MSPKNKKVLLSPLVIILVTSLCGKIAANQTINCDNPLQAGTEDTLILINWEDWLDSAVTLNMTNPQIVENIILPTGVTGYVMQGKNNSIAPKFNFVKADFSETWNHELNYKVFNVNAEAKKELEKTSKGRFVAIVYNKYKGEAGDSAFEIYGGDAGLVLTQCDRDITNTTTQGAFDIILKTSEKSPEPHMPKSLFKTDYATTKAIADGLAA